MTLKKICLITALSEAHVSSPAIRRQRNALPALKWIALAVSVSLCSSWSAAAESEDASSVAVSAGSSGAAAAKPATAEAGALKAFADVVKGATRRDGFIPLWQREDKVWLELRPTLIGKPLLLSVNVNQSLGERGLYASQMGPDWMVEWRKVGKTMQLVALNMAYRPGSDMASRQVVGQAFAESLIAAAPIVSAPEAGTQSVLVEANFLLNDLMGYGTRLEAAFRLPYNLDRSNSWVESARADEALTTLNTKLLFSTPKLPAPPLTAPTVPVPPPPAATPDPRSFFVGVTYNFSQLPAQPMRPRRADPRLGFFTEDFVDFSGDMKPNQRVHYVDRWRLEKRDPAASLSEPIKPITYWLDRNIPERYRASVAAGILEWNKAFERIGFKNAIVVKQQADDAEFDDMDANHASIRWFVGADVGFAIGPHKSDPRTGEILDADIGMSDVFTRGARRLLSEDVGTQGTALAGWGVPLVSVADNDAACDYAQEAVAQMGFALDVLEARGDIAPDSPEAEAFVQAVVKDVIMHEVGHTLGLKHNFKASTTVTRAQLLDKDFTDAHGISGSVMDYNAYNLPLRGEPATTVTNTTLGPYDYWAIEYAYKPLEAASEDAELGRIASRSTEPGLAYADDADAEGGAVGGLDPLANRFDLGDDPLAWYERRMALSKDLWRRVQARGVKAGDDPLRARRVLASGFRQLRNLPEMAAKYVGGMITVRDLPGTTDRPAYRPVETGKQREALNFLAQEVFSVDSFQFRPEFLTTLTPDYLEWHRDPPVNIPAAVLQLQEQALERLMSAATATRVLEQRSYLPESQRKNGLSLDEVYGRVQSAIWSELVNGREIEPMRRNLQRAYLRRVQGILLKGGAHMPADAVSLLRWHVVKLQAQLRAAAPRTSLSVESRAHLAESLSQLTEVLKATMTRG